MCRYLNQPKRLKTKAAACLAFLLTLTLCANAAEEYYSGGTGEPNNPFKISKPADWQELMTTEAHWAGHFVLTSNIDLNDVAIVRVGNSSNKFTGVFDGNDYVICNADVNVSTIYYCAGLFGWLGTGGQIKNLGVEDVTIACCNHSAGGLTGVNFGTISNCYSTGSISGDDYIGGLVGHNGGTLLDCHTHGDVSGNSDVGGVAGSNRGEMQRCYSSANVVGTWCDPPGPRKFTYCDNFGGLVGSNEYGGSISASYCTGSVFGGGNVGGLVGHNEDGVIADCYCVGLVSGEERVGGLVGANGRESIIQTSYATGPVDVNLEGGGLIGFNAGITYLSYWDVNTTGQATSDAGDARTTAQMKDPITFLGWACNGMWTINAGDDYPRFYWQNLPGEFLSLSDSADLYAGGSGTDDDPYLISTAEHLSNLSLIPCDWDKHIKLTADIDLSDIGSDKFSGIPVFTGTFDGNGKAISGFTCSRGFESYVGLFRLVEGAAPLIRDLRLVDANVSASDLNVGAMVGCIRSGTIMDCVIEGGSVSGGYYVGGLVGRNVSATILNSFTSTRVSGYHAAGLVGSSAGKVFGCSALANVHGVSIGGLIAEACGETVNCWSMGTVWGTGLAGGLASTNCGIIRNCTAQVVVDCNGMAGGLVGRNHQASIRDSYAEGDVRGDSRVGGLVGENYYGSIYGSYSIGTVSGRRDVGGLVGYYRKGLILNCNSAASVSGTEKHCGGLIGYLYQGAVSGCSATGSVRGGDYVGGLVGDSYPNSTWSKISSCYATGDVVGGVGVGGLTGGGAVTITHCYATGRISGVESLGGLTGGRGCRAIECFWNVDSTGEPNSACGAGKNTDEMKDPDTFLGAGWDFWAETANGTEDIWAIDEGEDYPRFVWEVVRGFAGDVVDFGDYCLLADYWGNADCESSDDCGGVDVDFSGGIDFTDLRALAQYWLSGL